MIAIPGRAATTRSYSRLAEPSFQAFALLRIAFTAAPALARLAMGFDRSTTPSEELGC